MDGNAALRLSETMLQPRRYIKFAYKETAADVALTKSCNLKT
jgi:hypothetical protein